MAGQMGHIIPKTLLQPRKSYNPTLCGISSGLGDIYYRLITDESADVMLHAVSMGQASMIIRKATSLCSTTGLPLDGQFRHLQVGDDINTYYHFVPQSEIACGKIMHDWHKRKEYHWQLCCDQNFFSDNVGVRQGEVHLESAAMAPAREIGTGHFFSHHRREPAYTLTDSYEAACNNVLLYGSPNNAIHNTDDEVEDSTSEIDCNPYPDGVPASLVYEQQYPIHYCEAKNSPSVGVLMLKYGIKREMSNAGVTVLENQELYAMAAQMENLHSLMSYKAPHPISALKPVGKTTDTGAFKFGEEQRREADNLAVDKCRLTTTQMDKMADKIKKKAQKRAKERKEMQEQIAQKERDRLALMTSTLQNNAQVQITSLKNKLRAFAKAWNADITVLEVEPAWQAWDGMEDLQLSSTGSLDALACRYSNILRQYDNLELVDFLRKVPRICRGELCRILLHMMDECRQYLTASSRDTHTHNKLRAFFAVATDNLQHCNILTEEELHSHFGCNHLRFDNWHCYGSLPFESFVQIPIKWTEEAENCDRKHEHTHAPGPGEEGEGKFVGTGTIYRPENWHLGTTSDEKSLESKLSDIVEETISNSPNNEEQGFRSAREHCSAQSPAVSPSSAAANFSNPPQPNITQTAQTASDTRHAGSSTLEKTANLKKQVTVASKASSLKRTTLPAAQATKKKSVVPQKIGSTVASRTRAKTKMAAALKELFSTGSSIKSYQSLDDMHLGGVTSADNSAAEAAFEKVENDGSAQSAPASTHGSPHFYPSI